MANNQIWGNLARAVNDNTTIDSAIATAVQAHGDDPDAHLAADQALQSHAAAEIIDHRAESIVNDKLASSARRYVAIVDPNSEYDFDTIESAVAFAKSKGGGDIFIVKGTHAIAGDVHLGPYISLYGAGKNESIIVSTDATPHVITPYGESDNYRQELETLPILLGATTVTLGTGITFDPLPRVGTAITDANGYFSDALKVLTVIGNNQFTCAPFPMAQPGGALLDFLAGCNVENNSAIVTLEGDQLCSDWGLYPGARFRDVTNGVYYYVYKTLTENSFQLTTPFTGATGFIAGFATNIANGGSSIEDLTFSAMPAKISIDLGAGPDGMRIENCYFIGGGMSIDMSDSTYNKAHIQNCTFECNSTDYALKIREDYVVDCVFRALENGSKGVYTFQSSVIRGCFFLALAKTNNIWFYSGGSRPKITNCEFEGVHADGLGTSEYYSSGASCVFTGCYISMSASQKLSVTKPDTRFIGCYISHSVGYPVTINYNTLRAKFIGTFTTEAIDDQGTTTQIVGDAIDKFITAAAADTAMSFKTRETVQLTPNSTRTLTSTVPYKGKQRTLIILTSGTTTYTLTFGTGFKTTGTLATGATSALRFIIEFISDGTYLIEMSRTAAIA